MCLIRISPFLVFCLIHILVAFLIDTYYDATIKNKRRGTKINIDSLNDNEILAVLARRGIFRTENKKRSNLLRLFKESGSVRSEDLLDLDHLSSSQVTNRSSPFRSEKFLRGDRRIDVSYFLKEIKSLQRSSWLVLVHQDDFIVSSNSWKEVVAFVSQFGINSLICGCRYNQEICTRFRWNVSQLVLFVPQKKRRGDLLLPNTEVHVYNTLGPFEKTTNVLSWISAKLSRTIQNITSTNLSKWMDFKDFEEQRRMKLLISTHDDHPNILMSSVALTFNNHLDVGTLRDKQLVRLLGLKLVNRIDLERTTYIFLFPSSPPYIYGQACGEALNYRRLSVFIEFHAPGLIELFQVVIVLLNASLCIDLVVMKYSCVAHNIILWIIRSVKFNSILFISWLILLGVNELHLKWMDWISDFVVTVLLQQYFTKSGVGMLLLCHWPSICSLWCWAASGLLFGFGVYIVRHVGIDEETALQPGADDGSDDHLELERRRTNSEINIQPNSDIDDNLLQRLVERLSVPALWLPADSIAADYIQHLTTWKFELSDINETSPVGFSRIDGESEALLLGSVNFPPGMIPALVCTICLERYQTGDPDTVGGGGGDGGGGGSSSSTQESSAEKGDTLCGLPCGHSFHAQCIYEWLKRDRHNCPICRWPAYRQKL